MIGEPKRAATEKSRLENSVEEVAYLYRKSYAHQYSIEEYFARVQQDLAAQGVQNQTVIACAHSKGLLPRLKIALQVARRRDWLLHITGDITFAALAARGKVAITIHDIQVLSRLSKLGRIVVGLLWFELPIRRADLITVNSEETARRLREHVVAARRKQLHVVPVSIADAFVPSPKPFNAVKPIILQVGTKANKNVQRLVEALSPIDCTLRIIGPISEALRVKLEASNIEYENMIDLSKEELVRAYRECDLLVIVSTEEGFGMPIVEAQRTGRPVVTSSVSSMPEVAGDAACLVDPFDVDSIRAGLLRVIHDDSYRNGLVVKGFDNAARFDRSSISARYRSLYKNLR